MRDDRAAYALLDWLCLIIAIVAMAVDRSWVGLGLLTVAGVVYFLLRRFATRAPDYPILRLLLAVPCGLLGVTLIWGGWALSRQGYPSFAVMALLAGVLGLWGCWKLAAADSTDPD